MFILEMPIQNTTAATPLGETGINPALIASMVGQLGAGNPFGAIVGGTNFINQGIDLQQQRNRDIAVILQLQRMHDFARGVSRHP